MMNKTIYDNPILINTKKSTPEEIDTLITKWDKIPASFRIIEPLDPAFIEIDRLNRELEAASTYIEEHEVVHLKIKKNIPTVIQYQGRRYVYDDRN